MPRHQLFFEKESGGRRVEVIKTYDRTFAHEAFDAMNEAAQAQLWKSLGVDESYDRNEISTLDRSDLLWEEMSDAAREDGNLLSFFVVTETTGGNPTSLYVSPDWPSAEAFAMGW
jgi:hypothetical protein